ALVAEPVGKKNAPPVAHRLLVGRACLSGFKKTEDLGGKRSGIAGSSELGREAYEALESDRSAANLGEPGRQQVEVPVPLAFASGRIEEQVLVVHVDLPEDEDRRLGPAFDPDRIRPRPLEKERVTRELEGVSELQILLLLGHVD